jgi:hypothetical protein
LSEVEQAVGEDALAIRSFYHQTDERWSMALWLGVMEMPSHVIRITNAAPPPSGRG